MSHPLLNPGESAKRPINPVPWVVAAVAIAALVGVLIYFGVFTRKAKVEAASEPAPPPEVVEEEPVVAQESIPAPSHSAPITATPSEPVAQAISSPPAGTGSLADAVKLKNEDKYQEAREACQALLAQNPAPAQRENIEKLLGEIHIGLVFSPRQMPEKTDYTVQIGDSLDKLARKFGTSQEMIRRSNNLQGSMIRVGDRFRIFSGVFTIKVDKSDNSLLVLLNDAYFKRYKVGTGQYNKTPVGTFKITDKIAQPTWWRGDGKAIPYGAPENLLGTHWLAIDVPGYGIHGTWEPETIGKQSSAGCIRLVNEDVAELFALVPVGTAVIIED